jgi:hypothetical protein
MRIVWTEKSEKQLGSGTKQSGLPEFKHGDIVEDHLLLEQAKNDAWNLLNTELDLEKPEHKELKKVFELYFKERSEFFGVGQTVQQFSKSFSQSK